MISQYWMTAPSHCLRKSRPSSLMDNDFRGSLLKSLSLRPKTKRPRAPYHKHFTQDLNNKLVKHLWNVLTHLSSLSKVCGFANELLSLPLTTVAAPCLSCALLKPPILEASEGRSSSSSLSSERAWAPVRKLDVRGTLDSGAGFTGDFFWIYNEWIKYIEACTKQMTMCRQQV